MIDFRQHDGANQMGDLHPGAYSDYTNYVPINTVDTINDPNHWQPLRFSDGQGGFIIPGFLTPHWGKVISFALKSHDQFLPKFPVLYPHKQYMDQANAILNFTANLDDKQKLIAEYWADGPKAETPPGHWNLFAKFVSHRDNYTLDKDIKLFFALNNALLDASISVWDTKRYYDYVRPITALRYLYHGKTIQSWGGPCKGTTTIPGELWHPYQPDTFITPPFPEYISGHSTFSAAAAEILKSFTGSDKFNNSVVFPFGSGKLEGSAICPSNPVPSQNVILSWEKFSDAADEAGMSRRYGGIHFEDGDLEGRAIGKKIGKQAWNLALNYFNGKYR